MADSGLPVELGDVVTVGAAGLIGAVVAGLVFQVGNPDVVRSVGAIVGAESLAGGWLTVLGLGILLGVPFVAFVSGSVDAFVDRVIVLTSRSDALRKVLVPLLNVSALGVTLFALGLLYGFGVGVVVFGLAAPAWAGIVTGRAGPYLDPVAILGWTAYGAVTGLGYGLLTERYR